MKCDVENRLKVKRGSDLPWSKLTENDVRMIRQMNDDKKKAIKRLNDTCSARSIAKKFNVHTRTIEKVLCYETWIHVL